MTAFALNSPGVYPSPINRACALIDESQVFRDLPDGYLRIIIRLIKKISIRNPSQAIVVARETLAEESGKSIETVHRAIRWLEDRGLIQRAQRARPGLKGSSSPIYPTPALIEAIGINEPVDKSSCHPNASSVSHDTSKSIRKTTVSEKEQSSRTCVRIAGFSVPSDLAWLCKRGLKPTAVLLLMKLAGRMKQRLSDVVQVSMRYLQPLHGHRLFAYLRKLVSIDRDYAWLAKQSANEARRNQEKSQLDAAQQSLVGKSFVTRDGETSFYVESNGLLSVVRSGAFIGCRPMDYDFLVAITDGRLRPVR
jgi:hypothetical protein